jgi:elongation factor 2
MNLMKVVSHSKLTLDKFARIYSEKFKIDPKVLVKKFWGDNFYDPVKKKFVTEEVSEDGRTLKRAFVEFIMDPIISLMKNIMENKHELVFKKATALGIKMKESEKELQGKALVRAVFMKWLNAGDILMEMIVKKLPSPK